MLEAINLAIERHQRTLFANLCLRFDPGDIVLLTGENGTGKTTLLKILAGLLPPTQGYLSWQGRRVDNNLAEYLSQLIYIGHSYGLSPIMRVCENLDFLASLDGLSLTRAEQLHQLKRFELHDKIDTPLYHLSAGQVRKVALSRLWLTQKKNIWFLDEPLTAIDTTAKAHLQTQMRNFAKQGGLILLSSHQEFDLPTQMLKHIELTPAVV